MDPLPFVKGKFFLTVITIHLEEGLFSEASVIELNVHGEPVPNLQQGVVFTIGAAKTRPSRPRGHQEILVSSL